jgi:hypothetical protein
VSVVFYSHVIIPTYSTCSSILRLGNQQSHDEILGLLADILPVAFVEDYSAVLGLFDQVGQVLAAERRVTTEKSVGNDAERPHVDRLAMSLLEHDLGCCVAKRAGHGLENAVGAVEMFGDSKVGEYKSRVVGLCQVEEVLGFEICTRWSARSRVTGSCLY